MFDTVNTSYSFLEMVTISDEFSDFKTFQICKHQQMSCLK